METPAPGRSSTRTSAMAYSRASRFRAGRFGGDACRRRLSAELARVFHLARRCAILTQDAIGSTLDYMASIQNSEVVFDYMELPQAFSEEMRELVTQRTEQLEKIDERWASRFEPAGIAAILRSHGFCDIEDINYQEITSRFGRAVQGLAPGQLGLHVVHAKH